MKIPLLPYSGSDHSQSGFTLIELMLVIAISSIIAGFSLVSLRGFADNQELTETTKTFYSAVQLARSRAQTQVKPNDVTCQNAPLEGYQVALSGCTGPSCTEYTISPICGGAPSSRQVTGKFPPSIVVSTSRPNFLFQTLTGRVSGITDNAIVTFARNGKTKSVTIFTDGRIEHTADN